MENVTNELRDDMTFAEVYPLDSQVFLIGQDAKSYGSLATIFGYIEKDGGETRLKVRINISGCFCFVSSSVKQCCGNEYNL